MTGRARSCSARSEALAGDRDATAVVQGYVAPVDPPVERAPKTLGTWSRVVVPAGDSTTTTLRFGATALRRWDDVDGRWVIDPGPVDLIVAASATDERHRIRVTVT